ncbi:ABC transporter permease [Paenirhodobacter populi]|uniref:ABC transporter permease n=1 Tax=Paenirhodobacter populi TaxID=2306993 RepID=A0A443J5H0_9RHOB|nr:ABC transporter permease [Sinirhodobacter populi]RWR15566.1 ABC transporter permease [Sinirhodobacter populi]
MKLARPVLTVAALLGLWQGVIVVAGLPPFLLPGPLAVAEALWRYRADLAWATLRTGTEIITGFGLGAALGIAVALLTSSLPRVGAALRPVLLVSQTIPIFALAPILTLWLGYGMAPKIAVTVLITFFPVASAFLDGLGRTPAAWLDLAQVMGASRWRVMTRIRIPAALPALGTGLTIAAVYAPVGAVIGEWVGGSEGLGALMIHANGRMRIDLVFACLVVVTGLALAFHAAVARLVAARFARYG